MKRKILIVALPVLATLAVFAAILIANPPPPDACKAAVADPYCPSR